MRAEASTLTTSSRIRSNEDRGAAQGSAGSLRIRIRQIHLWLGLLIGAHLLIMGLSGSALVFREEWNAGLEPPVSRYEERLTPQVLAGPIASTLEREFAGHALRMLVFPDGTRPLRATLQRPGAKSLLVYLDPVTTSVIGQTTETPLPDRVADFHHNLLAGRTGRVINGVIAVILLLLIASGLWLWCTQKRPVPLRLTIRWSSWRRANYDFHTAAGFWLTPFPVLMAFSAIYFAWHEPTARFLDLVTFSRPARTVPRASGSGRVSLQAIVAAAIRAMPEASMSHIRFPEGDGEPIIVRVRHEDEWRSTGSSQIYLNPSDASLLLSDRTAEQPLGTRIVRNLAPLHFGEFGGWPTRVLWLVLGFAPGLLFLSGFLLWRKRTV